MKNGIETSFLVVAESDSVGDNGDPADVPGVRSLVILVVKNHVESRRSRQLEAERQNDVLHRQIDPPHRTMVRSELEGWKPASILLHDSLCHGAIS